MPHLPPTGRHERIFLRMVAAENAAFVTITGCEPKDLLRRLILRRLRPVFRMRRRFTASPLLRNDRLKDVVNRDHTKKPAAFVNHRQRRKVVICHENGEIDDIGRRVHPNRIRVHDCADLRLRARLDEPGDTRDTDKAVLRIDDVHDTGQFRLHRRCRGHHCQGIRHGHRLAHGEHVDIHQPTSTRGMEMKQCQQFGAIFRR